MFVWRCEKCKCSGPRGTCEKCKGKMLLPKYTKRLRPPTSEELLRQVDAEGWIEGVVAVDLSDVIANDLEGFLDILSEQLTDTPLLQDISWEVVGQYGDELHLYVTGDATSCLEESVDITML